MALISKTVVLSTANQDLVIASVGTEGSVHGLVFQNTSASPVNVTMGVFKSNTGLTTTFGPFAVPANGFTTWPKPINMEAGDKIVALAATTSVVSAVVSYYSTNDIDTAVSVGFAPRGAYSTVATYAVNDVVYYSNGSFPSDDGFYISRTAGNLNNDPRVSTANWMPAVTRGAALKASGAEILAGTDDAKFVTSKGFADALAGIAMTVSGTQTLDFSNSKNFYLTLNGALTLANPTLTKDGANGIIYLIQDATGGRVWSRGTSFKKAGATDLTLSTPANKIDRIGWYCRGSLVEFTNLEKDIS